MKILNSQVYVGPNIYALFPVIRLTLDLGLLEEWPTERLGNGFDNHGVELGVLGLFEPVMPQQATELRVDVDAIADAGDVVQ